MLDEAIFDDTKGDDNSDGSHFHNMREDEKAHFPSTAAPVYV